MKSERSFGIIIIKPDMVERSLEKELMVRLKKVGLEIVGFGEMSIDLDFIKKLYQWTDVYYPIEIGDYLCKRPLVIWFIKGENAIESILNIKKEMRQAYCVGKLRNLFHCPDSQEEFEREYELIISRINMNNTKTNNQVEVFLFKQTKEKAIRFLLLRRIPEKGGFWQPVTGNVLEKESFEEAAYREIKEETGVSEILKLVDTGYSFRFFDDNRWQYERVFGAQISESLTITLSHEHTEFKWLTEEEALNKYLKWPGNKKGLEKLAEILETRREVTNEK